MKKRVRIGLLLSSVVLFCALGARGQFSQGQKLVANPEVANAAFGSSTAVEGNLMVIGAPLPFGSENKGAAYVFEKSDAGWTQTARLTVNDPGIQNFFGLSVATKGGTIAVGASRAIYLFEKVAGVWGLQQKLTGDAFNGTTQNGGRFSGSIAFTDGLIAVGAPNETDDNATNYDKGAVYIFTKSGGIWNRTHKLRASDGVGGESLTSGDYFGRSIAVSGQTLAVGAENKNGTGAVYIFELSNNNWVEKQKLFAADAARGDFFGMDVAMFQNTLVVGAGSKDQRRGAVYVFKKVGNDWGTQQTKITPDDATKDGTFGRRVSIYNTTLSVGASGKGVAYIFEERENKWDQIQRLVPNDRSNTNGSDLFGYAVAVSATNDVVVGAINKNEGIGAAYIFSPSMPTAAATGCGVTRMRLYPRPDCCAGRTIGGRIQVSLVGKNGPWQTLLTIEREAPNQWNDFALPNGGGAYKAIRFFSPEGGYGNVAELEFYNGDQLLKGTIFDDGSGSWNGVGGRDASRAFDSNFNTFYDANAGSGSFLGLELNDCAIVQTTDCALTKVRLFPRTDCCAGRTIGGKIQVSMVGENGPWETVHTIASEAFGQWNEFSISGATGTYKAVRYLAPDGGYGNVAELEFYNGTLKLTGGLIDDGGGPWSGQPERTSEKVFDNNTNTYYDANNANGSFVGLKLTNCSAPELPKPCALTEIRYSPRLDCCFGRTIGGKMQVSTVGKNGPWQTIVTFEGEGKGQTILGFGSFLPGPYKAIRYLSPDWGYGNIAELEFYNGNQKLTGNIFADAGGSWNGSSDRTPDKAFDGNPNTFYDANNANGAYVGLELTNCNTGTNRLAATEAETAEATWSLRVAPNPSAGQVKAQMNLPKAGHVMLTLTNVLGQEVGRQDVDGQAGANTVEVNFARQPAGLYLLRVQTEGEKPLVQKLLKRAE